MGIAGDVDTSDFLALARDNCRESMRGLSPSTVDQKDLLNTLFIQSSLAFLSQQNLLDALLRHRALTDKMDAPRWKLPERINITNC